MSAVILGIDPGLAALGFGFLRADGPSITPVRYGVLRTKKRPGLPVGRDMALRVDELARAVAALIDAEPPSAAAIEEFRFYGKAVTSSLQLSNVVGMLREVLRARGIPCVEYSAQHIKRAVTGNGNADKRAVQRMVQLRLALPKPPRPEHAADALAAAITYAARLPLIRAGGGAI